jgi:mannose-6-phosphate isomerase
MQPIVFEPIYMERIWGGRRLESVFGKKLPPQRRIGESWEIVDRVEAQSVVRQGPWRGKTLHELWMEHRAEIFGRDLPDTPRFPLLIKLLDASEKLSLQVHPPEAVASSLGGEAKTEFWYFAACEPGAEIFAGLRSGVERDHFVRAIRQGSVADLVHRVQVRTGDGFFVPSGRLHGIGPGNLIVEIQQNSDTTYRVFDWERTDENGEMRTLHLEKSMRSIRFDDCEPQFSPLSDEGLIDCPYFVVEKWDLTTERRAFDRDRFAIFFCSSGAAELDGLRFKPGDFWLVPASARKTMVRPMQGGTNLLRVTLPNRPKAGCGVSS